MEATKSGGTRKARPGRNLLGRIVTFPPIEFLKKYNPLRRRRHRRGVKLGFDQPPQEIKKLALPLRSAPPSLSMRLFVRVRPAGAWVAARCATVFAATRSIVSKSFSRARNAANWAGALIVARLVAILESRAVRWCQARVDSLADRVAPALQPAAWHPTQTATLMSRTQQVRRVLAGTVVCEWTALSGLLLLLATLAVTGRTWDRTSVNGCGLILSVMSLAGLALHAWHTRLVGAWQGMELFICGACGGLRNFSPSLACPNCGTQAPPVFPGQTPAAWQRHWTLLSPLAVGGPALVAGILLFGAKLV